jgi:hypothetical protein
MLSRGNLVEALVLESHPGSLAEEGLMKTACWSAGQRDVGLLKWWPGLAMSAQPRGRPGEQVRERWSGAWPSLGGEAPA